MCVFRERLFEESSSLETQQLSTSLTLAPFTCCTNAKTHLLPLCHFPLAIRAPEAPSPDGLVYGSAMYFAKVNLMVETRLLVRTRTLDYFPWAETHGMAADTIEWFKGSWALTVISSLSCFLPVDEEHVLQSGYFPFPSHQLNPFHAADFTQSYSLIHTYVNKAKVFLPNTTSTFQALTPTILLLFFGLDPSSGWFHIPQPL